MTSKLNIELKILLWFLVILAIFIVSPFSKANWWLNRKEPCLIVHVSELFFNMAIVGFILLQSHVSLLFFESRASESPIKLG